MSELPLKNSRLKGNALGLLSALLGDFRSSGEVRSLLFGALGVFALNLMAIPVSLILQVALAQRMGLDEFGSYEFVFALLNIVVLLATRGVDLSATRFVAHYKAQQDWPKLKGILRWSYSSCVRFSVLPCAVLLVTGVCLSFVNERLSFALVGAVLVLPLFALNNVRQGALKGFKRVVAARFPDIIFRPMVFTCFIFAADNVMQGQIDASLAFMLHAFAAFFALMLGSIFLSRAIPDAVLEARSESVIADWVPTARSLMIAALLIIACNEFDKILVGLFLDSESVGLYAVASRLAILIGFGMEAINTIIAPLIAELYGKKELAKLQTVLCYAALTNFVFSLSVGALLYAVGPIILNLYGDRFVEASSALRILVLGQLVNSAFGPWPFLLLMTGRQAQLNRVLISSLVFMVVAASIGMYFYGLLGAALVSTLVLLLRSLILWRKSVTLIEVDSSIFYAAKRLISLVFKR